MKIRSLIVAATLASGVGLVMPATAQARPHVNVEDEIVRPWELGPDKTDWTCTYQQRWGGSTCTYTPGEGQTPQVEKDRIMQRENQLRWSPGKAWKQLKSLWPF